MVFMVIFMVISGFIMLFVCMITLCLHNVHIGNISKSSDPVTAHSDRGVQSH